MPSATQFKKTFGIDKGLKVGSWQLEEVSVRHVPRTPFEHYDFPVKMVWTTHKEKEKAEELVAGLSALVRDTKLIYSEQGSPYDCSFGPLRSQVDKKGRMTISATGKAIRRRDIPTQAQLMRTASAATKEAEEEMKKKMPKGVRVIKSRFGTGKCSICTKSIGVGETIAKKGSEENRGGWSHLACAVEGSRKTKKEAAAPVKAEAEAESSPGIQQKKRKMAKKEKEKDQKKKEKEQKKRSRTEVSPAPVRSKRAKSLPRG